MATVTDQNIATMETILAQIQIIANDTAATYAKFVAEANSLAPLESPVFTGTPTTPTAPAGTNTNQLATTKYLDRLIGAPNGLLPLDANSLIPSQYLPPVALTTIYTIASQAAMLALPALPGDIAVRTDTNQTFILTSTPPSTLGNWTELLFSSPVTSVAGLQGAISASALTAALNPFAGSTSGAAGTQGLVPAPAQNTQATYYLKASGSWVRPTVSDLSDNATLARLASPTFTGTPSAPTAAADTNTTQLATTAYVIGQAGSSTPVMDGTAAVGTSLRYARQDHVHPSDTSRAPLVSPALSGTPTAPTAATATNTTQIATTAYVKANIAALVTGVGSVFGRTGAVTATSGDYSVAQITGAAPLASPTFTGTPSAPTPGSNINTTQIPTTAWVNTYFATLDSPSFTGAVGINSGTLTASSPALSVTQTWNNSGVNFIAKDNNVSNTASGGSSRLERWKINNAEVASIQIDGSYITSASYYVGGSGQVVWSSGSRIGNPSDGVITLFNNAQTGFTSLRFGGNGSGFPALYVSSATSMKVVDAGTLSTINFYAARFAADSGGYFNFGDSVSASGYGIRDNAGTIETKNNGGTWSPIATGGVVSVFGRSGAITSQLGDYSVSQVTGAAPIASPTFTGKVTTAASATGSAPFNIPQGTAPTSPANGDIWTTSAAVFARINGATQTLAQLTSPAFTGNPTAPTQAQGNNSTRIATTAYVDNATANIDALPVGSTIIVAGNTPPSGTLEEDGSLISRTTYAALWAYAQSSGSIGSEADWTNGLVAFSTGNGSTTFRIPDSRGEFLRGWDHGRGVDGSRAIGSRQDHQFQRHGHAAFAYSNGGESALNNGTPIMGGANGTVETTNSVRGATGYGAIPNPNVGLETRPRNIAKMFCIKY